MPTVYAIDGLVPVVDPTSFVHPTASLIGDVIIGSGCYIGPGASLRGDFGRIVVGAGSNIQDNCIVHSYPNADTILEEDAHIAHGAVIHCCTIKRNALVGMGAVVLDDAVVGEDSYVAAQALVRAGFEIPPRSLAAGIPAKVLRDVTDEEAAWKVTGTAQYQRLAQRCLASFSTTEALTAPEQNRTRIDLGEFTALHEMKKR
jgi:phenylacetic acid degradation protein